MRQARRNGRGWLIGRWARFFVASNPAPAKVDQRPKGVEGDEAPDDLAAADLTGRAAAKIVLRHGDDPEREDDEPDDLSLFSWRALSEWCLRQRSRLCCLGWSAYVTQRGYGLAERWPAVLLRGPLRW